MLTRRFWIQYGKTHAKDWRQQEQENSKMERKKKWMQAKLTLRKKGANNKSGRGVLWRQWTNIDSFYLR